MIENNIPEPEPSWDYYLTFHKLLKAQSNLEKLISYVRNLEDSVFSDDLNESINEDLFDISSILEDTRIEIPVNNLSDRDYDDE